jgi:type IV pilus assembly protein PilQ
VKQKNFDVGSRLLRSIRLTQQGTRTRLVIDLETPVRHETTLEGNSLLVTLRRIPQTAPGERFQRFGAAGSQDRTHRIQDVDFRRDGTGAGSVIVRLSDTGVGVNVDQQGRHLILDFVDAGIAPDKALRLDVQDFATPIYSVDTRAVGGNVRMRIETSGQFDYSVYESGLQLNIAVIPLRQEPEVAVSRYR